MESKLLFEFGPFRLDSKKCILWANGNVVHVEPKAAKTLLALVRAKGRPVDKNELIAEVWEGIAVTDSSLTRNISLLRSMLDEFLPGEECIKTIPKIGYRFALEVSEVLEENSDHSLRDGVREKTVNDCDGAGTATGDTAVSSSGMDLLGSGNPTAAETQPRPTSPRGFNGRRVAAMTFVLLLPAMLTLYLIGRVRHESPRLTRMPARPASKMLAVYGFKNLSRRPDKDWLATALAEMLSTELGVDKSVDVLTPEQVARARSDLSLVPNDDLTLESLQKIRKMLNVDLVVVGSYTTSGADHVDKIRVDIRVQNTLTGETVSWMKTVGWEDDLLTLVDDASKALRKNLDLPVLSAQEAASTRGSFPTTRKAAELYSEGLAKLRAFDALAARGLIEKAAMVEPRNPLIHAALARALADLGYELAAKQEGERAVSLAQDLHLEERLSIEGQYRETTKEWAKAVAVYRSLFEYTPGKLEYGLKLAEAQAAGGDGRGALATIGDLRRNGLDAQDPRLDLAEARAQQAIGDYKATQQAASTADANGVARGARLLVAESLLLQAYSSYKLGNADKGVLASEQAEEAYRQLGNEAGVARALITRGNALRDVGEVVRRKKLYEDAIVILKRIGNTSSQARALNALAGTYQDLGNPAQARAQYQRALDIFREIGDKSGFANSLNNIGTVFETNGDLVNAKKMYEQALSFYRQAKIETGIGMCTDNVAGILLKQGKLVEARGKYEEVLRIYQNLEFTIGVAALLDEIGDTDFAEGNLTSAEQRFKQAFAAVSKTDNKLIRAETLRRMANVAEAHGNFSEAESQYREAIDLVDQVGSHFWYARLDIAGMYIAEERYSEAVREAQMVAEDYEKHSSTDDLSTAKEVLARALLGDQNLRSAREAIESARKMATRSQTPRVHLAISITRARIMAATDPSSMAVAKTDLMAAMAESKKNGFQTLSFEAQLAMVEVEMLAREVDSARRAGEKLSKEASSLGFVSIANRAQALIGREYRKK